MKKEYQAQESNKKKDNIEEPRVEYGKSFPKTENQSLSDEDIEGSILLHDERPCRFTPQQLKERVIKGLEEIENGEYVSHEEMKKRFMV